MIVAGRALTVYGVENGFALYDGEDAVAWLGDPKFRAEVTCSTRGSTWTFARLRRGHTEALLGGQVIARYRSGLFPGGTIEMPGGERLRLRPPIAGQTWRVRRHRRDQVIAIRSTKGPWEIDVAATAADIHDLSLLTTFAFHAFLVEVDRPGGGDGGGTLGM